jgi:hypothetical protein
MPISVEVHKIYAKSAEMLLLEKLFSDLKSGKDADETLSNIERVLQRKFDLEFNVTLINNKTNNFFGMSIYPSRNLIDTMVDQMINKRSNSDVIEHLWAQNKKWYLEIDSILVSDPSLNANPAEMVAILLHEIGHIIYSNTVPARINKVMRYEIMQLSFNMKKLLKWQKTQILLDLIFAEACGSTNFHKQRELDADKFVVKMGYGDNLSQFIDKLLTTQGNSLVDRSERDMEKELKSVVTWTFINISELEYRKTKLRSMLQTEILKNPSRYIRTLVFNIKTKFFGGNDENSYKEIVSEQFLIQQYNVVVNESLLSLFDKYGKLKKFNQSDIDIITVEKDRIENEDDKIYVLDLIYDKLDEVHAGLELISTNKKDKVYLSKDKFLNYKAQLEKLRKDVLEVKLKDKQYGVFVQYPVGYEG